MNGWILTLILSIIGLLSILLYLFFQAKHNSATRNTTIIFYFNLENKSFKLLKNSKFNLILPFSIKSDVSKYSLKFYPISRLDKFFANQIIMKKIRNAYYELQNSDINNRIIEHLWSMDNQKSIITIEFNKTNDTGGMGKFVWKMKKEGFHTMPIRETFASLNINKKYKTYSNMYAIKSIKNMSNSFCSLIATEISANLHCTSYFVKIRGVFYFLISLKSENKLKKTHLLLIKLLNQNSKINYLKHVSSIGYISLKSEIISQRYLLKMQQKLDYVLYTLKLKEDKPYGKINFYLFDDVFSKMVFERFKHATLELNNILKTDNVKGSSLKIYNTKTTKSSGRILMPYIGHIMNKKSKEMIYTKWVEYCLIDFLVKKINQTTKTTYPRGSIIEVNYPWLIRNYRSIINYNYLYSIPFYNIEDLNDALPILNYLSEESKIKYGIKITPNLVVDQKLLKKINISFVVISESLSLNLYKRKEFSKVLLINKIFENSDLKIIYINPSPKLDDIQREELKIKYAVFPK